MKKILNILFVCILALCLMTSCSLKKSSKNEEEQQSEDELVLAAPVVVVSEDGLASWEQDENAQSFIYKLNGSELATYKTSLQLSDGDVLQVKAVAKNPYKDSEYSEEVTYTAPVVAVYGLPKAEDGFYMRDADVLQSGNTRYLVYTTNKTALQEDSVIAVRIGELTEKGWLYGEEHIILEASEEGWDQYLGSASLVKGEFALNGESYQYLLAYQGTTSENATSNQIGFAVSKEITGPYIKLENPVITYDAVVYGANMVGCYAPSLVNYNKASGIRLFYTLADAYGHFSYFADFDLSDLSTIKAYKAMITNKGELQGGDAVTMFPNADFAYDAEQNRFYAVKDVSPSPSVKPSFADEFEVCYILEEELYTTDEGDGWQSVVYKDFFDLEVNRAYSACIVSDEYGHMLTNVEIIYNNCEVGNDYLFTQHFESFVIE